MTDAALGVVLALAVALLVGVLHPISRPWVLASARYVIAGLAAALAVTALVAVWRRPKGGGRGTVAPETPAASGPVLVVPRTSERKAADKAQDERDDAARAAAEAGDVDGLADMEAELRRRAGLPPAG